MWQSCQVYLHKQLEKLVLKTFCLQRPFNSDEHFQPHFKEEADWPGTSSVHVNLLPGVSFKSLLSILPHGHVVKGEFFS
jgi:hypothetical protein